MSKRLEGKRAIVVGAGQTSGDTIGNGRATALRFSQEGATVACIDRNLLSAKETVERIEQEGGTAFAVEADVTNEEDCARLVQTCRAEMGGLDILVNNVGIGTGDRSAEKLETDDWDRIMTVNLKAMWMTIKHAVPVLRDQDTSSIVNISSLAAVANGNITAYEISKAGVNRLTTNVASANARFGIRCNALMLGLMDTPMAISGIAKATGQREEDLREIRNKRVPLGRQMGSAWDSANAALFLASHESKFITGAIIPVDGGTGLIMGGR